MNQSHPSRPRRASIVEMNLVCLPLVEAFLAAECIDVRSELTPATEKGPQSLMQRLTVLKHPCSHAGRASAEPTSEKLIHMVPAAALYDRLQRFCGAREYQPPTKTAFGMALSKLGFQRAKSNRIVWIGLRLK
jgi:hypothetical protein